MPVLLLLKKRNARRGSLAGRCSVSRAVATGHCGDYRASIPSLAPLDKEPLLRILTLAVFGLLPNEVG